MSISRFPPFPVSTFEMLMSTFEMLIQNGGIAELLMLRESGVACSTSSRLSNPPLRPSR